jgi:putative NADH-flavin reductase
MNIVVFGATGGTGKEVLRQALEAGHHVTAFARQPRGVTIQHRNLRVVRGDVLEPPTLNGVLSNVDAVLSALGAHSGRQPTYVYSRGMKHIREAMKKAGVRRIVALSAVPVSRPQEKKFVDRYIVHPLLGLFLEGSYDDLRRMEADLREAADIDWTVIRAPRLADKPVTSKYRLTLESQVARAQHISRADLATAMLHVVNDPSLFHKVVIVSH